MTLFVRFTHPCIFTLIEVQVLVVLSFDFGIITLFLNFRMASRFQVFFKWDIEFPGIPLYPNKATQSFNLLEQHVLLCQENGDIHKMVLSETRRTNPG
jgi:hypothetical protein